MIAAVLAAGASRRFGSCKLIEPISGKPMIQHVVESLPPNCKVVVVTGPFEKEVQKCLKDHDVQLVSNPDSANGIGTSVKVAAKFAMEEKDSLLITLADLPFVDTKDYESLIGAAGILPLFSEFKNIQGPPAVIPEKLVFRLLELKDDKGAKSVFSEFDTFPLPLAAKDIDRPEDLDFQR